MSDFHSLSLNDVFKKLNCTSRGLCDFEAAARQKNCGVNAISEQHKTSVFKLFLAQFKDFMVLLLIAAAFISATIHAKRKLPHLTTRADWTRRRKLYVLRKAVISGLL